jgi:hypothetical protein
VLAILNNERIQKFGMEESRTFGISIIYVKIAALIDGRCEQLYVIPTGDTDAAVFWRPDRRYGYCSSAVGRTLRPFNFVQEKHVWLN